MYNTNREMLRRAVRTVQAQTARRARCRARDTHLLLGIGLRLSLPLPTSLRWWCLSGRVELRVQLQRSRDRHRLAPRSLRAPATSKRAPRLWWKAHVGSVALRGALGLDVPIWGGWVWSVDVWRRYGPKSHVRREWGVDA